MASPTDAPSSQVATLYGHSNNFNLRWSEFGTFQDEADELEARMVRMAIVHRLSEDQGSWYVFSGWSQLKDLHAELKDDEDVRPDEKQAYDSLVSFLDPILAPSVGALKQTFATTRGVPVLGHVLKYKKKEIGWRIHFEKLAWDGSRCGYVQEVAWIERFSGDRYVNSLNIYPLSFHKDPEGFKIAMLERGRNFERLRGYHAQSYKGSMHLVDDKLITGKTSVEGRVIIDTFAYYASSGNERPNMRPVGSVDGTESRSRAVSRAESQSSSRSPSQDSYRPEIPYQTSQPDEDASQSPQESESGDFIQVPSDLSDDIGPDLWGRNEDLSPLTDEQCLIADPWLTAFDLKTKRWGLVDIDGLSEVEWKYDAFDNLVVPDDEKQLAWDFVESKTTSNEAFDDFIPDKGRGIIILMFGPPGVGKTFTAEAVAERANVPLYSMSASALGTEPAEIEQNLDKALQVCKLWNAMLLLDEADVFLAARQSESMKRNELVSLFLTKLEYYPGILFLTTNRASDIDFAFQSRVDLFLPYYELTPEARLKIWNNFIDRAGREGFSSANMEADLEKLSRLCLNGREIKNLVKTSQLLSQKTGGFGSMEKLYFLAEKRVHALKLLAERGT
ncbi:hypothetical protein SLS64_005304 [Diaporthe eres]